MEGIKFNKYDLSFGKCVTNAASMKRMEDANDAIAMIVEGGQFWLLGWCIVYIISTAILNYAGR